MNQTIIIANLSNSKKDHHINLFEYKCLKYHHLWVITKCLKV